MSGTQIRSAFSRPSSVTHIDNLIISLPTDCGFLPANMLSGKSASSIRISGNYACDLIVDSSAFASSSERTETFSLETIGLKSLDFSFLDGFSILQTFRLFYCSNAYTLQYLPNLPSVSNFYVEYSRGSSSMTSSMTSRPVARSRVWPNSFGVMEIWLTDLPASFSGPSYYRQTALWSDWTSSTTTWRKCRPRCRIFNPWTTWASLTITSHNWRQDPYCFTCGHPRHWIFTRIPSLLSSRLLLSVSQSVKVVRANELTLLFFVQVISVGWVSWASEIMACLASLLTYSSRCSRIWRTAATAL